MASVDAESPKQEVEAAPSTYVAPSPHIADTGMTTRGMMLDVLLALTPAFFVSLYVFRWYVVAQVGLSILGCVFFDSLFAKMRGRAIPVGDFSAVVTGVILGMSLPWSAPWYIPIIASGAAIGLGKAAFGGLGFNLFNPAMVGRAFVMLSFASALGATAYVSGNSEIALVTQATPLSAAKAGGSVANLWPMFLGTVNGSVGETSALALLVGGIYLCLRRAAAWRIPVAVLLGATVSGVVMNIAELTPITGMQHGVSGALMFGAFFIATDPVSSPVTTKGRWIFGIGVGVVIILLRVLSSYPEGVMFAVLLMNATVPLINRWTIPRPLGGPMPKPVK